MAKLTIFKVPKSPSKSHIESSTGGKKTGCMCQKTATAVASEAQKSEASGDKLEHATNTVTLKAPARIVWDKFPERKERLLDYLDTHTDVAIKLFGDSTQAAKSEGRSKLTAKSNKGAAYLQVADGIFSIDDDETVRADFVKNPSKYAKVVDNYITNTLKKQYRAVNECIGRTRAGLKLEDVTPGSEIANIIEKETENFKWWPRLHGYWHMLPNFNPYIVSSDPGQNLADEALSVLIGGRELGDIGLDDANLLELGITPDADNISTRSPSSISVTPLTSAASSSKVKPELFSTASSQASTPKRSLLKWTLQDAFVEGSARESETTEHLRTQKHERALVELELKRCKLDHRAMDKQHQREHKCEQHEYCMMQMQIMMSQNQQSVAGMVQPPKQPLFGGLGLMDELNDPSLPSRSGSSSLAPYSI